MIANDLHFTQILNVLPDPHEVWTKLQAMDTNNFNQTGYLSQGDRINDPFDFEDVKEIIKHHILKNYVKIHSIQQMSFYAEHQTAMSDFPGIIHRDETILNFMLFVDPAFEPHRGTSVYNNSYQRSITTDNNKISQTYQGNLSYCDYISPFNSQFADKKIIEFQPVFNSLAVFPGYIMHGRDKNLNQQQTARTFFVGFIRKAKFHW